MHIRHGEADLYKEVRIGNKIHFKPVDEFISLKLDQNGEEENGDQRTRKLDKKEEIDEGIVNKIDKKEKEKK